MTTRVLLTGATGFVGARLYPALREAGFDVTCATRSVDRASARFPEQRWVQLDVQKPHLVSASLQGIDVVYYLVHAMAEGHGFAERERDAARHLAAAAALAGVKRIIYLGGVAPEGSPSEHLASRLETGEILRRGAVACIELRAGMIIGAGSASWKVCRDLAARLPFMLLPRWLESRSQPVHVGDVVAALVASATSPIDGPIVYDIPGPETLSAHEILVRIAALRGTRPVAVRVPVLTPKLSSYWLKFVTGADYSIARELVEGLGSDLVAEGPEFWSQMPDYLPTPFDAAARAAFAEEGQPALRSRLLEALARRLSRSAAG